MKIQRIVYFAVTGLLSLMMLLSAGMMLFNNQEVSQMFVKLGYPAYVSWGLGVAKFLGLIAIWSNYSKTLKEWAYAGFFFNFLLAFSAHINAGDGDWGGSVVAMALLLVSYTLNRKIFG